MMNRRGIQLFALSIYTLLFLCVNNKQSIAQDSVTNSVRVIARPMPDSIMLRWGPTTFELWNAANKAGYIIERFTILRDGVINKHPKGEIITTNPLKPLPLKQWEPLSKHDDYIGVAAQAIFGETFEVAVSQKSGLMDIVNKAEEQENRFSFALFAADQSPLTARASGLWFTDRNVKKGESYLYKVYLGPQSTVASDTGYVYTSVDEYSPLPVPNDLKGSFGDKMVILSWSKEGIERFYNGFYIEKSIDGGKTYRILNRKSFINPDKENGDKYPYYFYMDTLRENNKECFYRVFGISPFGEKGSYSNIISGNGLDEVKDNPRIVKKEIVNDKAVRLTWEFPQDKKNTISGFRIIRSKSDQSGYKVISGSISPDVCTFIDTLPMPTNYYKVQAFKEGGLSSFSLPALVQLIDSIPPAPPKIITAEADTSGKVVLRWKANPEQDIYGYRVYRANNLNEEFSQITIAPVQDTILVDDINLNTLSKSIFYQLVAVDNRQNFSGFSEPYQLTRPDTIPPVSPVIHSVEQDDLGINISWHRSTSEDVVKHVIYRKTDGQLDWMNLHESADSIKSFKDTLVSGQTLYNYQVVAFDQMGLKSRNRQSIKVRRVQSMKGQLNLNCKVDREQNQITLSWDTPKKPVKQYIIYRKAGENTLTVYANVSGKNLVYVDRFLQLETRYGYCIKMIYQDGEHSPLSNIVLVTY